MEYTCKLLYWFRKVQYKPSFFNRLKYRKLQEKHGNEIPRQVTIGEGLYLGHIGPRYINAGVVIGKNCNINHNVAIGQENRGKRKDFLLLEIMFGLVLINFDNPNIL